MKKLLSAGLIAAMLAVGAVGLKADGCGNGYCSYSGSYWSTQWSFPWIVTCYWNYTIWDNGSYAYYDTCGGASTYYMLFPYGG